MSIFLDSKRNQGQDPERLSNVLGDLIDGKSINYENVLNSVRDTLINWSLDLVTINNILLDKDKFFNQVNNDPTIKTFVTKLKGDLFESNKFGTFSMNYIYDLFNELKTDKNCADNSPNTGSTNTCYIVSRELDDKRSVLRLFNTRLKKYKKEFDDVWGRMLSVQTNSKDDKYVLYTTGTTFTSFSNAVTTLNNNYNNMKSEEGKLIKTDSGNGLNANIPFNDNIMNSKVNINYKI